MKSVLISIQPRWCELIASGKKTVEIRKSKPKLETPFKVYIYMTKDKPRFEQSAFCEDISNGKVIGEFVCDRFIESFLNNNDGWFVEKGCLTQEEIDEYQGDKSILYGWHISDLVIYDKPKELNEFATVCDGLKPYQCDKCEYSYTESNESCGVYHECCCNNLKPLKRPPQSWCYVKSEK
jgi:predicted transcriptional regulator